jgi:hypothetical protein
MKELLFDTGLFYVFLLFALGIAVLTVKDMLSIRKKNSLLLQFWKTIFLVPMYILNILLFDNVNFSNAVLKELSKEEDRAKKY